MENQNTKMPVLTIRGLTKHLGGRLILDDINVDVYPGEIFGFLGPNGSGKTTTIKLMLGLLKIEKGEIMICGHNIATEFEAAVENVGGIIENPEMYKYLSGRENLMQYKRMYKNIPDGRIDEVIDIVGLRTRIDDKISKYSLGMRQRLGVAQALLHNPRLLVLDEPTNGLDPAGIKELRDILKNVTHQGGASVFISSHLLSELELMCDRVGVIDRGRMIGVKSMEEVQDTVGDGREQLELTVGDIDAATKLAQALGYEYTVSDNKLIVTVSKEDAPKVIREIGKEIDIFETVRVKKTLETAFLEMTNNTRPQNSHEVGVGGFENSSNTKAGIYTPPADDKDNDGGESK